MDTQEYDLILEDRRDHLYACVEATRISLGSAIEYVNRVMERSRSGGHRKLLWVRRVSGEVAGPQFRMVASVIVNLTPKDLTIAFVDHSPVTREVEAALTEEASIKKRNIRTFRSIEDAREWLLEH